MLRRTSVFILSLALLTCGAASAQGQAANGKLQIYHLDVGQGDGAVLISPKGEVVLFDMGEDMKRKDCQKSIDYLEQLGIEKVDYLIVSHYHFDHIGCVPAVLKRFPLTQTTYDRGASYPGATYKNYATAVGAKRTTAVLTTVLTLDKQTADPVEIDVISVNAGYKGGMIDTSNENDLSVAALVKFGGFREEIGGDLSGEKTNQYEDIETPVSASVGEIDVYKVHHHCSSYSTNYAWLNVTRPTIAVISTGDGNAYRHPTEDCLQRLHEADLKRVYWTEEGAGAKPQAGLDVIGGDIGIEVAPRARVYVVHYGDGSTDTYDIKAAPANAATGSAPRYVWSARSKYYYTPDCPGAQRISRENLRSGDTPPAGKIAAACVK